MKCIDNCVGDDYACSDGGGTSNGGDAGDGYDVCGYGGDGDDVYGGGGNDGAGDDNGGDVYDDDGGDYEDLFFTLLLDDYYSLSALNLDLLRTMHFALSVYTFHV